MLTSLARFPVSRHRDVHFATSSQIVSTRFTQVGGRPVTSCNSAMPCTVRTACAMSQLHTQQWQTMYLCFLTAGPRKFQFPYLVVITFRATVLRIGSAADPQSYTVCDSTSFRCETDRVLWCLSRVWSWLIVTWHNRHHSGHSRVSGRMSQTEQYTAVYSSIQQYAAVYSSIYQYAAVYSSMQQYAAVYSSI